MTARVTDADPWFVDLKTVADRIDRNQAKNESNQLRIWVLAAFVLAAFLLLAWRSETNADRITQEQRVVAVARAESCARGVIIIAKFNALQDRLSAIERDDVTTANPIRRDARVEAYEAARILPLPNCP